MNSVKFNTINIWLNSIRGKTVFALFALLIFAFSLFAEEHASAQPFAYIAAGGDIVSVIDTSTNTIVDVVDIIPPTTAGVDISSVSVSPGGIFVYGISFLDGVYVIDGSTQTVVDTITLPGISGHARGVFNHNGDLFYVANINDGSVSVIDTFTNMVVDTITGTTNANGIAVSPDDNTLYVSGSNTGNLYVIDTITNMVVDTITGVGPVVSALEITPDGNFVYVVNDADGSVSVLDTSTLVVVDTIMLGIGNANVNDIALSPDGNFLYAPGGTEDNVYIIDTSTNMVVTTRSVGTESLGVSVTPDGNFVYVVNDADGSVSVLDTSTLVVVDTIPGVGPNPRFTGRFIMPPLRDVDLTVVQDDFPDPVVVGEALTYTLFVLNNGPNQAPFVTLTDTLPAGVTFVSASPGCTESGGVVTCSLGHIAVDSFVEVDITVTAPSTAGSLLNTAEVTSGGRDIFTFDNLALEMTTVIAIPQRTITVNKAGTGTGTVTSNPAGIDCGIECDEDVGMFDLDTTVELVAVASNDSTFEGFTGDPDCEDGFVLADVAKTCIVTFDLDIVTTTTTSNCSIAGPNTPSTSLLGLLLYAIIPALIIVRRRVRK